VDRDFVGLEDLQYADVRKSPGRACTKDQGYLGGHRRRQEGRRFGNTCKGSEDTGDDSYRQAGILNSLQRVLIRHLQLSL
jgi:hypothetical protein